MNPYHHFVSECVRTFREAKSYPLGGFSAALRPELAATAPKVLFFAPHPDDETIAGGLALRLLREARMKVINVAVTQGSNKSRQAERLRELQNACDYVGFELIATAPGGLEKINFQTRANDPRHWRRCVDVVGEILGTHTPRVIFFPHEHDWNSTHIGTHFLVMDALSEMPRDYECHTLEIEFWGQMTNPNLMVEISPDDLADLIAATSFHVGEVKRNPYHLLLPAWMIDNVRRGSELVGGQGSAAPDFMFAALYRLRQWRDGHLCDLIEAGKRLSATTN